MVSLVFSPNRPSPSGLARPPPRRNSAALALKDDDASPSFAADGNWRASRSRSRDGEQTGIVKVSEGGKGNAMNATRHPGWDRGVLLACLAMSAAILVAGLWPFDFLPKNDVAPLHGEAGIRFGRLGIAYSAADVFGPRGAIRPGRPVAIELVVRPGRESRFSLAQIFTLCTDGNRQLFTIAQWKSNLILRSDPQGSNLPFGSPEISVKGVLRKNVASFLTVVSKGATTVVYVDGRPVKVAEDFPLLPSGPSGAGKLVLGNSPTGREPWEGDLLFLASYDRALSAGEVRRHVRDWAGGGSPPRPPEPGPALLYRFADLNGGAPRNASDPRFDLAVPKIFAPLTRTILRPPWREEHFGRPFVADVLVNILGFLPFGFVLAARSHRAGGSSGRPQILRVVLIAGCTSVAIELLQVLLPSRVSSLTDVATNILGAALGACLFRWVSSRLETAARPA